MAMMKAKAGRICFVRMVEGDDLLETIKKSAEESGMKAAAFTLIGALKNVVLGCYRNGEYVYTRFGGPMEIASCTGNIAVDETCEVVVHSHIVVSNEKAEAFGGHLMKGSLVGPTAELVLFEAANADLRRVFDDKTKLKLLQLG
jgi:predicted DNA-binding protein with PD1-like motif